MKLALLSCGLFLLSYIAVSGGLGPQPARLIVPLLAALGTAAAARWFMGRGRKRQAKSIVSMEVPVSPQPMTGNSLPPPRASGSKARKLF